MRRGMKYADSTLVPHTWSIDVMLAPGAQEMELAALSMTSFCIIHVYVRVL